MEIKSIAENINILGNFCGKRDIDELNHGELKSKYNINKADIMVLFGGSIIAGGDAMAKAMENEMAEKYIIVGGAGHTTETLRKRVNSEYPDILTMGLSEAQVFEKYLDIVYGYKVDFLETKSTNCGNNITYLLELLKEQSISSQSIILCQDATMQRRMDAGLRKYVSTKTRIINFPAYKAEVICKDEKLQYDTHIHGMWDIDRYVNLLMGEIPRLRDDINGYGPKGKKFIAHVDIPDCVENAFEELMKVYGSDIRGANPLYASK